jgi:alkyl hydroperoxide reductase subunit AhpC
MPIRTATVGSRAPSFSLECTDGQPSSRREATLDDYLDRWLMLLFYSRDFSLV